MGSKMTDDGIIRDAELTLFWEKERMVSFKFELRAVLRASEPVSSIRPEEEAQDRLLRSLVKFGRSLGKRGRRVGSVRETTSGDVGLEIVSILDLEPRRGLSYEDLVDEAMLLVSGTPYSLKVSRG